MSWFPRQSFLEFECAQGKTLSSGGSPQFHGYFFSHLFWVINGVSGLDLQAALNADKGIPERFFFHLGGQKQ
jgi:hypothetical protein